MDYVITYVNNLDKEWLKNYTDEKFSADGNPRFRDFGFLRYHLRMVEKNLPFIDNVILIVSSKTQVPKWINQDNVRIVLHEDFMPKEVLPTYNSSVIETFMCNIPGLSDRFIYANDDMFTLRPLRERNFFINGKIVMKYLPIQQGLTKYFKRLCENSYNFVNGQGTPKRPYHFLSPIYTKHGQLITKDKDLISTCSKFRDHGETKNLNQYIFTDYEYTIENYTEQGLPKTKFANINNITHSDFIDCDILCINDESIAVKSENINMILNKFQFLFPNKSKYELEEYQNFYLCAMIKDEHLYLKEWIDYHINLGFTEIYLYEDDGSKSHIDITNQYPNVYLFKLSDYIPSEYMSQGAKRQYTLFNIFIKEHNQGWCLFTDIDEYLHLNNCTLKSLTDEFYNISGIKIKWKIFGANGHIERPKTGTLYDNYTEVQGISPYTIGISFKTFVNLSIRNSFFPINTHYYTRALFTNRKEDKSDLSKCWIDHFITMSFEDYYEKRLKRGCVTKGLRGLYFFFEVNSDMKDVIPEIDKKFNIKEYI